MADPLTITLHYDPATARALASRYWRRAMAWRLAIGVPFVGVAFAYGLWNHDRSWFVGAMGALLFVILVITLGSYAAYRRAVVSRVARLEDHEVRMTIEDDQVVFDSSAATMRSPWNEFRRLLQYWDQWVLERDPGEAISIPTRDLDDEAKRRLVAALVKHKVPVRRG